MSGSTTATVDSSLHGGRAKVSMFRRLAAACGLLYPLGIVIGDDNINGAGEAPDLNSSIGEVNDYLGRAADASANGSYWIGRGIGVLAFVALLVFTVYVARSIRVREGSGGLLSGMALGGGLTAVALGLLAAIAQFAAVGRADEGIDPEVARALFDLSTIAFVLTWLPLAVLIGSVAVAGIRNGILSRWVSIAGGIVAAALLAGLAALPADAAYMAMVLSWLWFIAAGIVLIRRAGVERV
jgi:hypothetical protein